VGAAAATLKPLVDVIRTHVFAAERIHADDTTGWSPRDCGSLSVLTGPSAGQHRSFGFLWR
jgi:hypothetical protein